MRGLTYVGIDPGQTGAIATIADDGSVEIHDYPGDERALADIVRNIHITRRVSKAFIELQQSRPGMGIATMFKLGQNYGVWLGILACVDWSLRAIRPSDWKNGLGYPVKNPKASKQHSLTIARRLYPQAADYLARKSDHNRAEALLLAHLAMGNRLEHP